VPATAIPVLFRFCSRRVACFLWMKLIMGALKYQSTTISSLTSSWFKVYHNRGKNKICERRGGAGVLSRGKGPSHATIGDIMDCPSCCFLQFVC